MDKIKKIIGQRIRFLRTSQDLKQEALADKAGLDQRIISQMENGRSLSMKSLEAVIRALGVDIPAFFKLNIVDKTDEEIIEEITTTLPTLSSKDLRTYYKILKSIQEQ